MTLSTSMQLIQTDSLNFKIWVLLILLTFCPGLTVPTEELEVCILELEYLFHQRTNSDFTINSSALGYLTICLKETCFQGKDTLKILNRQCWYLENHSVYENTRTIYIP